MRFALTLLGIQNTAVKRQNESEKQNCRRTTRYRRQLIPICFTEIGLKLPEALFVTTAEVEFSRACKKLKNDTV